MNYVGQHVIKFIILNKYPLYVARNYKFNDLKINKMYFDMTKTRTDHVRIYSLFKWHSLLYNVALEISLKNLISMLVSTTCLQVNYFLNFGGCFFTFKT